jgi:Exostosin family
MKIYLAPCSSTFDFRIKALREIFQLSRISVHTLVDTPEDADIILITDHSFVYKNNRRLLSKYLDQCYLISDSGRSFSCIPGLYDSASAFPLHQCLVRGCNYLYDRGMNRNTFLDSPQKTLEKKYLFSFVGSPTSWVRKRLFKIKFSRNDILINCTTNYNHWDHSQQNREVMQKNYISSMCTSKFVLCPRGDGCGSIRLFEAMELGIAPVILSDRWLPPKGPEWHEFALFVKESDLFKLPHIVESYASEYEERGRLARKAWEKHFSDPVVFNQSIEAIKDLKENRIAILDRLIFYSYPLMLAVGRLKRNFRRWLKLIILKLFNLFKLKFPYELVNTK